MKKCIHVAVTGGSGQIAYQLLFRLANGEFFGDSQPIFLHIFDQKDMLPLCEGIKMELQDCLYPLLQGLEISSDPYVSFAGVNVALLIGAKPRGKGMERKDLLQENGSIFVQQGKALNEVADEDAKIFVVGNPCNTNCMIARHHAPRLKRKNFFAMTRLDQNRASFFLAEKAGVPIKEVSHMTIWGNHSPTQVPDFYHAKIKKESVTQVISDPFWLENTFFEKVQQRGAEVIAARGKSSAASATQAIIDSIQDLHFTERSLDNWFSLSVDGSSNPYGIEEELVFSFPCQLDDKGEINIVRGLVLNEFLSAKIKIAERELIEERESIKGFFN